MPSNPETCIRMRAFVALVFLASICRGGAAPAIEWASQAGARFVPVQAPVAGKPGFTPVASPSTGVTFTNHLPAERHYANQILLNGSGVAAGDVDGDGGCDLFFAGLGGGSRLYRNLGGWKFREATTESGLGACAKLDATGAVFGDLDGDGDLDLLVNSVGQGTLLFRNDGRGKFSAPETSELLNPGRCGSSLALADIDGDGALDLYVVNYRTTTIRDQPNARFTMKTVDGRPAPETFGGRPLTSPELTNRFAFHYRPKPGGGGSVFHDELGEPDAIFRNQGGGRFSAFGFDGGAFLDEQGVSVAHPPLDWGLSVMIRDFNGDGAPDIYVCNDFATPDRFWLGDGKGRFRSAPSEALRQTSLSTMAIDVADINRDGFDDFFTADMLSREHWRRLVQRNEPNPNMHLFVDVVRQPQAPRNTLQLGRGDGTFAEVAQLAGLEAAEWGWSSIFLDVDLDGFEDLLVANGFERDYMNMDAHRKVMETRMRGGPRLPPAEFQRSNGLYPRLNTANVAFRNLGDLHFSDVSREWGFDVHAVSQGMCLADLDNDGDLDVVINNSNDTATLLRNDSSAPRVAVRLKGRAPNTRGIGAKIKLLGGPVPVQSQEMICGGRYLSGDDSMRVFAAGVSTNRMTIEVTWRSGARSTITNILANHVYEIDEAASNRPVSPPSPTTAPQFKDVSSLLAHSHAQDFFDDFARQPLLPNKLSTAGPGASWFDADGDGWDDLIIGGGRGGQMAVFRNDGRGGFKRLTGPDLDAPLARAQTAVLGWRKADDRTSLIAGSSNYEDGQTNGSVARQYELWDRIRIVDRLPGAASGTGPMALADVNGDGQPDLFVGGRCRPGRWPEAASSLLFRQDQGQWSLDADNNRQLADIGLVSGAVFSDIDGDGAADLVLAGEWGPIRILRNDGGRLTDATKELGLDGFKGWWNGVSAGDFDGDGRMDLVASNWGRNTKYERFRSRPLRLHFGDFNKDGSVGILESWYDEAQQNYVPILNVWTMSRSMPWLLERFPNYESFSRSSVGKALGERGQGTGVLEANWLDTTVFLNRGGRFEARPLPVEAQMTPAFAVCVADFDGDGSEDVFLSQNFFGVRTETSRYDAGRGLLLRGNGRGDFEPVAGDPSGLLVSGEQRGAAVSDYDGDGRADLVVTQAGGETRLFRNDTGKPGLRVRLQGAVGNRSGVGAVMRLKFGETLGPAREIHAGSGYWSQDSAVQVMAGSESPTGIWVRWPGGRVTELALPANSAEVILDHSGGVKKLR
jgi:hypothetical protein